MEQDQSNWVTVTWHGKEPINVNTYHGSPKVSLKPNETIKVHPVMAAQLRTVREMEVERVPYAPVGGSVKEEKKKDEQKVEKTTEKPAKKSKASSKK